MMLAAVILTLNEERHIERCLKSVKGFCDEIIVIDSFSTDKTKDICLQHDALFYQHKFHNYATQFNYGIDVARRKGVDWILRIDADEILLGNLSNALLCSPDAPAGYTLDRFMTFNRRKIRFGGVFPMRSVRLFQAHLGQCESTYMDEHILVDGEVRHVDAQIIDDNVNSITWWTDKHNWYASREAIDYFTNSKSEKLADDSSVIRRFLKVKVYYQTPILVRSLLYFLYRYLLRGGFRDGREGFMFHFLQGFWYRFLVDVKILQIKKLLAEGESLKNAILQITGLNIDAG